MLAEFLNDLRGSPSLVSKSLLYPLSISFLLEDTIIYNHERFHINEGVAASGSFFFLNFCKYCKTITSCTELPLGISWARCYFRKNRMSGRLMMEDFISVLYQFVFEKLATIP